MVGQPFKAVIAIPARYCPHPDSTGLSNGGGDLLAQFGEIRAKRSSDCVAPARIRRMTEL